MKRCRNEIINQVADLVHNQTSRRLARLGANRRISQTFRNQVNADIGNDEHTDSELQVRIRGLNRGDQIIITKRYEFGFVDVEPTITIGGSSLFGERYDIDIIETENDHAEHTAGLGTRGFVRSVEAWKLFVY